jgi:hypothetical protein
MQRIPVTVLLLVGAGPDATARVRTPDDTVTVAASLISAGTGIPPERLSGARAVALVDENGELTGFQAA